jgi:hypothetical protein
LSRTLSSVDEYEPTKPPVIRLSRQAGHSEEGAPGKQGQ